MDNITKHSEGGHNVLELWLMRTVKTNKMWSPYGAGQKHKKATSQQRIENS